MGGGEDSGKERVARGSKVEEARGDGDSKEAAGAVRRTARLRTAGSSSSRTAEGEEEGHPVPGEVERIRRQ